MENLQIRELFTRNYPFISNDIQQKLSQTKIALVGVGLSSQVAQALVRLGICNFKIWDNDKVSLSNLNRQAFMNNDIGKNKSLVTANRLHQITENLTIEVYDRHFSSSDIDVSLKDIDIVINSADFDTNLVYDINDFAQIHQKWCIQPLNLGFGGSCMIFGEGSSKLSDMTLGRQTNSALFVKNLLNSSVGFNPSAELLEKADVLLSNGENSGWFPQNIIATLITTSLITWSIVKIVEGFGKEISAPKILHFEPKLF